MTIKVVPFKPEHLEKIQVGSRYAPGECPKTILTTAFTLFAGEEILAIIGGFPFIPGVVHFWGLISDAVTKYPLAFHKECLKVIRWYEVNEKPRRIQIDVRVTYREGCRWAEALGFKREGTLARWCPDGSDAYLYGRAVA